MSYWLCLLFENSRKSDVNHLTSCMIAPQNLSARINLSGFQQGFIQQLFLRHAKKYYVRTDLNSEKHIVAIIAIDLSIAF